MPSRPRVSVILPAYNSLPYLQAAVGSILGQTFADFELIVGDDGSTDGTRDWLDGLDDPRIVRSHSAHNLGSLRTRNRLFALVRGDFVTFQDADDESVPHRLESLLGAFAREPDTGLVGSNCDYVDESGRFLSRWNSSETIEGAPQQASAFVFATLMVRRELVAEVGGFREYFWDLGNYDSDWIRRVTERTQCATLAESLMRVRLTWGSNSLTIRNPRKLLAHHIVQFLAEERSRTGVDSLEQGRLDRIDDFLRPLEMELARDPSRHMRVMAGEFARRKAFALALRAALAALRLEPLRLMNHRALWFVAKAALANG